MATPKGPFYKEFGRRLQRARRDAHVTQAELARGIGLSRTSIANIESGRQPVDIHTAVVLSHVLGTQIEKLLPELGTTIVCSGANLDDRGDYRPGLKAAAEAEVARLLAETKLAEEQAKSSH